MSEVQVHAVPSEWKKRAYVDDYGYKKMYAELGHGSGHILG